jgi:hypothetical protein
MNRKPVTSRNISSVGWEADRDGSMTGTLEVEFHSGHLYQYDNIQRSMYEDLITASSPGKYFAQIIKSNFDARRS